MIAFVTLLLGLIRGVYPIEVTVGGPVAAVEFTLDGSPAGRAEGPPWRARIDLGRDLRPHELAARALDAEGNELGRVSQWLNLPRPPAEVDIVLENDPQGTPRAAILTWHSVNGVKPVSIGLTLDGEPLRVDERGRAALPRRDLKSLHILTADLWFPPGVPARKDVVYGGEYGSAVSTELTAVPVRLRAGISPTPQALQGWLTTAGKPLTVAALEDGPGRVTVVRVPSGNEVADRILPASRRPVLAPVLRQQMRLGEDDRVRFLSLAPKSFANSKIPALLFDMSNELTHKDGGMFSFLTNSRLIAEPRGKERRIADAVAVAGLQAATENHRRAVVLVLGRDVADISDYDPLTVRSYLESIRVPLFIWSLYGPQSSLAKAWGEAEDISTPGRLEKAVARLQEQLASQRIAWVEGRHLPQAIALAADAGIELVGASQPLTTAR